MAQQTVPGAHKTKYVFAYHEIVRAPQIKPAGYDDSRCDVFYQGHLSPDFYGWVFPHGDTLSIGTGSADKGFSLRHATTALRRAAGLEGATTVRREGAPLPMKPLPRWDNGRDVVLAGDAAEISGDYLALLRHRPVLHQEFGMPPFEGTTRSAHIARCAGIILRAYAPVSAP